MQVGDGSTTAYPLYCPTSLHIKPIRKGARVWGADDAAYGHPLIQHKCLTMGQSRGAAQFQRHKHISGGRLKTLSI